MATYFTLSSEIAFPIFAGVINDGVLEVSAPFPSFAAELITFPVLDVTAPFPTFSGTLAVPYVLAVTAPFPSLDTTILSGLRTDLAVTAPFPSASFSLEHYYSLTATSLFPFFSGILAESIPDFTMSGQNIFPSFSAVLHISPATVAAVALVMNLKDKANIKYLFRDVTTYSNYNFNSFAETDAGAYLGANEQGIYLLSGANDAGTKIETCIEFGDRDFGTPQLKNIPELYFDCPSTSAMHVYLSVDGGGETGPYPVAFTGASTNANKRVKLPLNKLGKYYKLILTNTNGGSFTLRNITVPVDISSRKVN